MTQHTDQGQPSGGLSFRRSLLSVLTLLLLTGLMFLIFQDHLPEIRQAIGKLSPAQLGLLLALALTYPLIEGVISQRVLASRVPGFSFRRGLDLAFLGAFGNVVTFGAGTLPMQGYDISLSGLPAVPGMGLMTLQYVFHKGAVMVYAVLLLALNGRWLLAADAAGMMRYLLPACLMVAAIILALVLVCTSRTVQRAAYWALGRLPDTGKWQARRQSWTRQLDGLAAESRSLLADRKLCIQMFLLQVVKLALMYAIVWLGTDFMNLGPLTFWQAQTLAALMMLLSNALPNVGGMGSVEASFYLVFTGFLGQSGAMSVLLLYRAATYYFTFAVSCVGFFFIQRRWARGKQAAA